MKRFLSLFLALAVLTFFALFLFLPLFTVVAEGCDPAVMREVFRGRLYLQGMLNSLAVAAVTTLLVFLISIPLAALYDKYDFPGKAACSVLMMAPMILPPFVGALGFQQLLGHYGLLNSILGSLGLPPVDWLGGSGRFWSVCVIQALHLYPIAYLNLVTAFGNIDPSLLESARTPARARGRGSAASRSPCSNPDSSRAAASSSSGRSQNSAPRSCSVTTP